MYPLLLHSPFKKDLWGGDRLEKIFSKEYNGASQVWLLSADEEGESVVKNGELKGKTLSETAELFGRAFFGADYDGEKPFPLFIRLIDAHDSLPLDVCTKDRLIYIADADADARIIYGFAHAMGPDEIRRRLSVNTLIPACNFVPVRKGDIIKIPAGHLYAAGKGILCYEISFTDGERFVISDYGRLDGEGNRSAVRPEEALAHVYCGASGQNVTADDTFLYPFGTVSEVNMNAKAHVSLIRLAGSAGIFESESFMSVIVTDGSVAFSYPSGNMRLKTGDSVLIPAGTKTKFTGYAELLYTHI